jgi:cyclopropane-fatty-acyl-phospholipid synthase
METSAQTVFLELLDSSLADAVVRLRVGDREVSAGKDGGLAKREFCIRVHRPRFFREVLCYGNLGLGESFMRGDFEMEKGDLCDFLTALLRNRIDKKVKRTVRLGLKIAAIRLWNALRTRESNVQRHYDIGDDLFEKFLDPTLTYSCGYAHNCDDSLETLQQNKLDRICRKLRLFPGARLLDIGCGFGGLLIYAAEHHGITGTGITISRAHCERGNAEIRRRGLGGRVGLEFREYRQIGAGECYDRIVSVGMMEHVPRSEYDKFFGTIAAALRPRSVGLVHTIGHGGPVNEHDPFIQKYIFPDSNQPRLSEIAASLENCGLAVLDVENMIRHYAHTLVGWLRRFQENRSTLELSRYNAVHQRMWEYYLSCGIAAARASDAAVYQILFHNDCTADIPLQRV